MADLFVRLEDAAGYIKQNSSLSPEIGIVLGSGLGNLTKEIEIETEISYSNIPHFPVSTVKGHRGSLILGTLEGKPVVAMSGRFHFYEGYTTEEVVFPIRVMNALGIQSLIISNASGGLMPGMEVGDLMIINDHINMQPENPLRGKNDERLGPRFPDMFETYDKVLIKKGMEIAERNGFRCHQGCYVGVQGPTFETPAEYKMYHLIGGDAVGMSTVPEVIAARHVGLRVFAISAIADIGYPTEQMEEISHDIVVEEASKAEPKLTGVVKELIKVMNV